MITRAIERSELPKLGLGVYTLAEAARLTEAPVTTVRSWFRGRSDKHGRGPVFDSDYAQIDGDFAISFLDLIDVLVAGRFRAAGVSMARVRESEARLQDDLATDHPFAHACLYTDGRRVIVEMSDSLREKILYDALSKQMFFDELKEHLKRIEYDPISHLAKKWRIADGVVVDPSVCFGKPVVRDTGVATAVLARQFTANDHNEVLVADLYGLTPEEVLAAAEFERACWSSNAA